MTERTTVRQSLLDDDAISVTSTVSDVYDSDQEFTVNRILAEKTQSGRKIYLISWEGYPMEKSTWEPRKNIQDDEILNVWKERKLRESKGLDEPFDLAGFNALLANLAQQKTQRHRRRKAKRRRLGIAVSPSESENDKADESDSSVEAVDEGFLDDEPALKPKTKGKVKSPPKNQPKATKPLNARTQNNTSDLDATRKLQENMPPGTSSRLSPEKVQPAFRQELANSKISRTLSQSSSDVPVSRKRTLEQASTPDIRPGSSSPDGPKALKRPKSTIASQAPSLVQTPRSSKNSVLNIEPAIIPQGLPSISAGSTAGRGKVATRGGANLAHRNVFQSREPAKMRGNLLKNAMNAGKAPKKFSNMRLLRKAELQARDIAEAAPDISALPGGLFDPSRPESFVPIRPETLRKSSSNLSPLEETESAGQAELYTLFLSRENTPVPDDPWSVNDTPQAPPTERTFPDFQRATCFYWDRAQRDSKQPPCSKETSCKFQHFYEEGMPVAPRPPHLKFSDETREPSNSIQASSDLPPWRKVLLSDNTLQAVASTPPWQKSSGDTSQAGVAESTAQETPTPAEPPLDLATVLERLRTTTDLGSESKQQPAAITPPAPEQTITTPAPKVKPRPAWNPRDALNSICYFWATAGKCSWGDDCKYIHSNDQELAVAPSPAEQKSIRKAMRDAPERYELEIDTRGRSTCRYWLRDDCRYTDETCRFWHGPESAKVQNRSPQREQAASPVAKSLPNGSRVKSVSFVIDDTLPFVEEPESMLSFNQALGEHHTIDHPPVDDYKSKKDICIHWRRGDCRHGAKCWFRHEHVTGEMPHQGSRDVEMQDREEIARMAPTPFTRPRKSENLASTRSVAISEYLPPKINEVDIATHNKSKGPNQEQSSELPTPASDNTLVVPKTKQTKINMDDSRRKKALKELGGRAKEVTFGLDETQSLLLDFGDVKQAPESAWELSFSAATKVRFNQMCMAQDFQVQQGLLLRLGLWHGNLLPADADDTEAVRWVDKAADELVLRSAGLLSAFYDFLILTFPAKKEEWKFLESTLEWSQDARLRYFVFRCNLDIRRSLEMQPTKLTIGAPYRNILVDEAHGLDFQRLLPFLKKKNPIFYLLFPSTASQTANFIISWLRSSHHNCKIYSSQSEGSWHFFTHSPEIDTGTVLIHESAASKLDRLPNLYSIVAERNFAFWYISESSSPYPMFPSMYRLDDLTMGQLTTRRLFPQGCAFLLTPSFLVAELQATVKIFEWFLAGTKPKWSHCTPGTWKLVCCHNFADYMLELANSTAAAKEAFELKHRDDPAKDAKLEDRGLSFNQCKTRYKLHRMLVEFESKRSLESASEGFDSEFDDSEYPFIHADKHIDPDDERTLVNWFAVWTMRNLDVYKKFVVAGSSELPKPWQGRARRVKEVNIGKRSVAESTRLPTPNLKKFSIISKSSASPLESPSSPLTLQKQKALAIAAKISASGPGKSGITLRDLERNNLDDSVMEIVTSPQVEVRLKPSLPKASPSHHEEAHDNSITHGISHELHPNILTFSAITSSNARDAERFSEKANNDVRAAVDLFNGESVETEIMALITDTGNQALPLLATADADVARVQELYDLPSTTVPTTLPSSVGQAKLDPRSPPHLDGAADDDMYSPMGLDGTDDRPASSGTDSSKTSRSGIQTDNTGRRFVPRSVRPNSSVRKEIEIRPGYVPPEDKEVYQVPSRRGSIADNSSQSAVASPTVGDRMDMDSEGGGSGSERARKSHWQEPGRLSGETKPVLKEILFEPTTTWYKRVQERGDGWEHILVANPELAVKTLIEQKKA